MSAMPLMTLKDMTAHIRRRIKREGIEARVRMSPGGGSIQVFVPEYGGNFSEVEQRAIRYIAVCNDLTWVRGQAIDVEQMTNPDSFEFFMVQS